LEQKDKGKDRKLNRKFIIVGIIAVFFLSIIFWFLILYPSPNPFYRPGPCDYKIGGEVRIIDKCGSNGIDPSCIIAGSFKNVLLGQICCSTVPRCKPQ
jgi:hypothetical protein